MLCGATAAGSEFRLQNYAHLRRSKESGYGAKTRRRSQPKERKKSFSHPFHLRCCTRLKKCRANIAALVPLTGIEQHGLCSWVVVWTDDIVCSAILMLLVGSQLTSVWHLIVPLKVMFNTDASALAVPAAVLFVQWSHETDPNDRNRISSKTDVCFRQKWSVGSAESRGKPTRSTVDGQIDRGWQDKAGYPASGTSFLSSCLHIVLARSPAFRRDQRAALFPIIILFQCSERRRPRHAADRRWPYLRRRRHFHAASRELHFWSCAITV